MKRVFQITLCACLGILLWGCASPDDFRLTIVHTNDLHSHLLPFNRYEDCPLDSPDCLGGFARITSFMKSEKEQNPNTVILDAGDRFTGTSFYTLSKSRYLTPLFQGMPYDAITLGNHEFDDNLPETERFLSAWPVPAVVSNLKAEPTEALSQLIRPSVILERSGRRIGIIGVLTDETNILNEAKITIEPIRQAVADEVKRLKQQGVQIIIVLSHIGLSADKQLAAAVPDIDVIVGGHSHSLLINEVSHPDRRGPYPVMQGRTAIVSCGKGGQYVGKLDLTFDEEGNIRYYTGDAVPMSSQIAGDPDATEIIQQAQQNLNDILTEPLVVLPHTYGFTAGKNYCSEECPIGEYIAYLIKMAYPSVDGVMINSGSFRRGLPSGLIDYHHLIEVCPFDNAAVLIRLTGTELKAYLQHGLEHYHQNGKTNELLQTAGIHYEFDSDTHQIDKLLINSQPVEAEKIYTLLTSSFLASGGDRYPIYPAEPTGKTIREILKEQIKQYPDYIPQGCVVKHTESP